MDGQTGGRGVFTRAGPLLPSGGTAAAAAGPGHSGPAAGDTRPAAPEPGAPQAAVGAAGAGRGGARP